MKNLSSGDPREVVFGWRTVKQRCITLSTTEAELAACSFAAKEGIGLRNYFRQLYSDSDPAKRLFFSCALYGDNNSCNLIAQQRTGVRKVRHLALSHLYVREVVQSGDLTVNRVPTDTNAANLLTKVLSGTQLKREMRLSSLVDPVSNIPVTYSRFEPPIVVDGSKIDPPVSSLPVSLEYCDPVENALGCLRMCPDPKEGPRPTLSPEYTTRFHEQHGGPEPTEGEGTYGIGWPEGDDSE